MYVLTDVWVGSVELLTLGPEYPEHFQAETRNSNSQGQLRVVVRMILIGSPKFPEPPSPYSPSTGDTNRTIPSALLGE